MYSSGIIRKTDILGRIVIPKEIRRNMNISEGDPIEIFISNGYIMLSPCKQKCVCCGNNKANQLKELNGVVLCKHCIDKFGGIENEDTPHG